MLLLVSNTGSRPGTLDTTFFEPGYDDLRLGFKLVAPEENSFVPPGAKLIRYRTHVRMSRRETENVLNKIGEGNKYTPSFMKIRTFGDEDGTSFFKVTLPYSMVWKMLREHKYRCIRDKEYASGNC